jgi:hypothetical protein
VKVYLTKEKKKIHLKKLFIKTARCFMNISETKEWMIIADDDLDSIYNDIVPKKLII